MLSALCFQIELKEKTIFAVVRAENKAVFAHGSELRTVKAAHTLCEVSQWRKKERRQEEKQSGEECQQGWQLWDTCSGGGTDHAGVPVSCELASV